MYGQTSFVRVKFSVPVQDVQWLAELFSGLNVPTKN